MMEFSLEDLGRDFDNIGIVDCTEQLCYEHMCG